MKAFLYGVALQWKLDIRSKTMLITCYVVPLVFFAFMGGIFTAITPASRYTLIQTMTVFVISMGALVGLPPSLVETYGSDVKNVYKANGVPLCLGVLTQFLSAFIHLSIVSVVILIVAPAVFNAVPPAGLPAYFGSLALFIAASLGVGSVLGLVCKTQSKLTMLSQFLFLPSIMLSGIMFPAAMLPRAFAHAGKLFPAAWGYRAMTGTGLDPGALLPLALLFAASGVLCGSLLKKMH